MAIQLSTVRSPAKHSVANPQFEVRRRIWREISSRCYRKSRGGRRGDWRTDMAGAFCVETISLGCDRTGVGCRRGDAGPRRAAG